MLSPNQGYGNPDSVGRFGILNANWYVKNTDNWSNRNVGRSGKLRIGARLDGILEQIKGKFQSLNSKSIRYINEAARKSAKTAVLQENGMLPLGQRAFERFGMKDRFMTKADVGWKIGYSTGATARKLADRMFVGGKLSLKNSIISLQYSIPEDVSMKLIPRRLIRVRESRIGYSSAKHAGIASLQEWIIRKKIAYKSDDYKRVANSSRSLAFAIWNAWAKIYKPKIMNPDALSVTRNPEAKEIFVRDFNRRMDNLPKHIREDIKDLLNGRK